MKTSAEFDVVDWKSAEARQLFAAVCARGYTEDDIRRIIATEEDPREALRFLRDLSKPLVRTHADAMVLPPLPPRELDAHEEQLFLQMLAGEIEPQYE